ncbi:hypothetical protein PM082_016615 [Marasmius tenuissimus]|nr:hypothetical protein PM082_016615 [Marasmius tenuissimus]
MWLGTRWDDLSGGYGDRNGLVPPVRLSTSTRKIIVPPSNKKMPTSVSNYWTPYLLPSSRESPLAPSRRNGEEVDSQLEARVSIKRLSSRRMKSNLGFESSRSSEPNLAERKCPISKYEDEKATSVNIFHPPPRIEQLEG